jgi:signal transduction histidine kinase
MTTLSSPPLTDSRYGEETHVAPSLPSRTAEDARPDTDAPTGSTRRRSIANWSIARKVGVVLVIPALLAAVFGGLRVQESLANASDYEAALPQADRLGIVFQMMAATESLAAASAAADGPIDTDEFAKLVSQSRSALATSELPQAQIDRLSTAVNSGEELERVASRGAADPAEIIDPLKAVEAQLGGYLTALDGETTAMEAEFGDLRALLEAKVAFTEQLVYLGSPSWSTEAANQAAALSAVGREAAALDSLTVADPSGVDQLRSANDARFSALVAGKDGSAPTGAAQDTASTYDSLTEQVRTQTVSGLQQLTDDARTGAIRDAVVVVLAILAALALALYVARLIVRPLRRVRESTLGIAEHELPEAVEGVLRGEGVPEPTPIPVTTDEETGQLARAVEDLHAQALHLAGDQARLRGQVNDMFETLSRRSSSLVVQQLSIIEELERDEEDPERLARLFRLDHLAARMRRNGQSLLVLAGATPRASGSPDLPLIDILRAAMSEVQGYERLELGVDASSATVAGSASGDLAHVFAELMENALSFSPPATGVVVAGSRAADGGYLVEVSDRGLGMSAEQLDEVNGDLESGGEFTVGTTRRMGLFVVGRLADRHGLTVRLRANDVNEGGGVTASVHVPAVLVRALASGGDASSAALAQRAARVERPALASVPDAPDPDPVPDATPAGPAALPAAASGLPQRRPGASGAGADPVSDPAPVPELPRRNGAVPPMSALARLAEQEEAARPEPPAVEPVGDRTTAIPVLLPPVEEPDATDEAEADVPDAEVAAAPEAELSAPVETSDAEPDAHEPSAPVAEQASADDAAAEPTDASAPDETPAAVSAPSRTDRVRVAPEDFAGARSVGAFFGARSQSVAAAEPEAPSEPEPVADSEVQPVDVTADWASSESTPIFRQLRSKWLDAGGAEDGDWASPEIDAGWRAAEAAAEAAPAERTAAGLPSRRPGSFLVPGSAEASALAGLDGTGPRDPEQVRRAFSSHLSGVRRGREEARAEDGESDDDQHTPIEEKDFA